MEEYMSKVSTDFIRVEKVYDKPKFRPDLYSGTLLIGPKKYLNVAKKVDIKSFEAGNTYAVDIETNDAGYKTAVKNKTFEEVEKEPVKKKEKIEKSDDNKQAYWEAKDKSQMIGGLEHDAPLYVRMALEFDKPVQELVNMGHDVVKALIEKRKDLM